MGVLSRCFWSCYHTKGAGNPAGQRLSFSHMLSSGMLHLQEDLDAAVHLCGRHDASWRGQVCGGRPEKHDAQPALADRAVAT